MGVPKFTWLNALKNSESKLNTDLFRNPEVFHQSQVGVDGASRPNHRVPADVSKASNLIRNEGGSVEELADLFITRPPSGQLRVANQIWSVGSLPREGVIATSYDCECQAGIDRGDSGKLPATQNGVDYRLLESSWNIINP